MTPDDLTRRGFLGVSVAVAAGLVIGCRLPSRRARAGAEGLRPNAWVQVGTDGAVTIHVGRSEMGQGVLTSLATIVADELDADWSAVRAVQAPAGDEFGDQVTGGSTSVSSSWLPLRRAGAAARWMLRSAAAIRWTVPLEECRTEAGWVVHGSSGRRVAYGDLAAAAAELSVPEDPPLKSSREFRLIGRPLKRVDGAERVSGRTVYGMDVRLEGMRYAALARPPRAGARLAAFDRTAALAVPGVQRVIEVPSGVAVVADSTWAAFAGRSALSPGWEGGDEHLDSGRIRDMMRRAVGTSGHAFLVRGDADAALASASRVVEAEFEVPFLAHVPLEPMNCTAVVTGGRCEVWVPTQDPAWSRSVAARVSGVRARKVTVHVTALGGGFGRRLHVDYVGEAVAVAKAMGEPVQVVWDRADDLAHGHFRPGNVHRVAAGLDNNGKLVAWRHRIAGPSQRGGDDPEPWRSEIRGIREMPYEIPAARGEFVLADPGLSVGPWRSIAYSNNVFVIEALVDEAAAAAGTDPVRFRLDHLAAQPRLRRVLRAAAERARWGTRLPAGRGLGVAVCQYGRTSVAEIAEVDVAGDGAARVRRVTCAIDCGRVINPDMIAAQVEGGIAIGLSAALKEEVIVAHGRIAQTNFHDYPILRFDEMPAVDTVIVDSAVDPSGVGEPPVPPLAPAVANAIHAASGRRIRRLPILHPSASERALTPP